MGKSDDAAGVHESADAARDEPTEPWDLRLLSGLRLVLVLLGLAGAGLVILRRETGIADTAETVWWSVTGVTLLGALARLLTLARRASQRSVRRIRGRYSHSLVVQAVEVHGWVGALVVDDAGLRLVSAHGQSAGSWTHAAVRSSKAGTSGDRSRGRPAAPVVVVRFHQDKPLILRPLPGVWPWSAHTPAGPDAVQLAALLSTLQRTTH